MNIKNESIHEAVSLLNQGRNLPQIDKIQPPSQIKSIINNSVVKNNGISLLVSVSYHSLSGNQKDRDILIRRVFQSKGEIYIDGVAMDIRAPRLIKLSFISEIRDITSGRIYTDPKDFVQNRLGITLDTEAKKEEPLPKDSFSQVIERTGHEMTVLMYLVAIDGRRDKKEREKVFRYIKSRTEDLSYSDEELSDYLISLAPDEECFSDALRDVLNQDKSIVQKFVETILDIIMVDSQVDSRERAFLIRIMDLLEHNGYEISLPI